MHAELLKVTLYSCKWLAISCNITTQKCNIVQCRVQLTCVHVKITWQCKSTSSERGGSRGRVQEVRTPPPRDDLRFFNTTGILQKKVCDLLEETSAPPPKKNPGSTPEV